jgi:hypothetical protein
MKYRLILSKDDWGWYCQELDAKHKYLHDHEGEPTRFPCAVSSSRYEPDANSPYTFKHDIYYKDKNCCPACKNTTEGWPDKVKNNLHSPTPYDD